MGCARGGARYRPILEGLVPAGGDNHVVRLDPVNTFDGRTVRGELKDLREGRGLGREVGSRAKTDGNLIRTEVPDFS